MKITITTQGDEKLIAKLKGAPEAIRQEILAQMPAFVTKAKQRAASKVHSRTGKLASGIDGTVVSDGDIVGARLSVTGVPYGGIIERGGTIGPHIIQAVNAKAMMFAIGAGRSGFAASVSHPGSTIQGQKYMWRTIEEMRGEFIDLIKAAIRRVADASGGPT